jgi:hypothetical protein
LVLLKHVLQMQALLLLLLLMVPSCSCVDRPPA